jgi:hypothetical protein
MTKEEIFELAVEHGDWDDFGRWTFRDDDRLLAFAWAIEDKYSCPHGGVVKTYCGGKPNYCTPVDAVNMSQECVDETAKGEHEWKGLDGEIPGLGLVTEEFYNGMIFAEDLLREKNT